MLEGIAEGRSPDSKDVLRGSMCKLGFWTNVAFPTLGEAWGSDLGSLVPERFQWVVETKTEMPGVLANDGSREDLEYVVLCLVRHAVFVLPEKGPVVPGTRVSGDFGEFGLKDVPRRG